MRNALLVPVLTLAPIASADSLFDVSAQIEAYVGASSEPSDAEPIFSDDMMFDAIEGVGTRSVEGLAKIDEEHSVADGKAGLEIITSDTRIDISASGLAYAFTGEYDTSLRSYGSFSTLAMAGFEVAPGQELSLKAMLDPDAAGTEADVTLTRDGEVVFESQIAPGESLNQEVISQAGRYRLDVSVFADAEDDEIEPGPEKVRSSFMASVGLVELTEESVTAAPSPSAALLGAAALVGLMTRRRRSR